MLAVRSRSIAVSKTWTSTMIRKTRMPSDAIVSYLRWPYGWFCVRRPLRDRDADERDDVGRRVGERVKAVGQDRDRAGGIAEGDLDDGDGEVEDENAVEDADDLV